MRWGSSGPPAHATTVAPNRDLFPRDEYAVK